MTRPVGEAIERVKMMLFRPFDFNKWFTIGFCAWLATLGQGGGGGVNFNFPADNKRGGGDEPREMFERAWQFVQQNLVWIVPVAVILTLLGLALWVLVIWLSSRGRFMFLHCVVRNRAEINEPWIAYAGHANSLFRFRLVLWTIGLVTMLPVLAAAVVMVVQMVRRGEPNVAGIVAVVACGCGLVVLWLALAVVAKLTTDFVVPVMVLRGGTCVAAWRELMSLISAHPGNFVVYLLFQIVLGLAIAGIVLGLVVVTCCIAACLLAIPVINAVIILPVLVFQRSYSLHYLAQYGREFDLLAPAA